jgi:hypothetical protein
MSHLSNSSEPCRSVFNSTGHTESQVCFTTFA